MGVRTASWLLGGITLAATTLGLGAVPAVGSSSTGSASERLSLPIDAAASPYAVVHRLECVSASSCDLVGEYVTSSGTERGFVLTGLPAADHPIALVAPGNADIDPGESLDALGCRSTGSCVVGGSYSDVNAFGESMFAELVGGDLARGTELELPENRIRPTSSAVSALSCATSTCIAVGNYINSAQVVTSMTSSEHDGVWSPARALVAPDDLGGASWEPSYAGEFGFTLLTDLSCGANDRCVAVGEYSSTRYGQRGLLAVRRDGRWERESGLPVPSDAASNAAVVLSSVSCARASCTAVGSYATGKVTRPLLESASRGRWHADVADVLPVGIGAGADAELDAVACPSAGNCVAVGSVTAQGRTSPLVVREVRGRWGTGEVTPLPSSAASGAVATLSAVACPPRTSRCYAAGSYVDERGAEEPYLLRIG